MTKGKHGVLGLLERAEKLRTSLGPPDDGRDEFSFDPGSGISREDQKDILKEIENVGTQNRIAVRPEAFAVKAAKRGILFPVLVNLAAIVALAGGLGFLYFYFQRGETQLAQSETATITAEGKLIEEVKKESEARLQEKNQQINQIQDRLAAIDRQRQDLQSNMDAKVRERENQLRTALTAELDAEKARLQNQGLSEQEINRRLSALETRKNAESASQLAAFRAQAEADRQKSDENLKSLRAEFNANLAQANQERLQVVSESKKREADLQAQLEQKTKEAETAQARSEQALTALQSQKQQEDLVSGQLVGLYSVVKENISGKDYPKALTSLQAIRDYVSRPDIAVLPAVQQRRDVDLFVVDSLSSFVQGQLSPAKVDTSSLVAAAGQISEVRAAVSQADAQARAGNIAEAEKLYDKALSVIPEIAKSYAYFTTKVRDTENARQEVLRSGLARAEAAFEAGRYPQMLAAYKDALSYLPETSARLDRTLSNIATAGSEQAKSKGVAEQARAAAPLLSQGDAALAQGRPADALSRYLTILRRYPQSPQADFAVQGITNASTALGDRADARISAREKDLQAQVASLQKQVADLSRTAADAARQTTASPNQQSGQGGSPQELAALRARLSALANGYRAYTSREDPLLEARGESGLVDAKAYLDRFLGSQPVEETFPGLYERIRRYDQGFLAAGRTNAIQEVLDVVIEMSKQKSPDARSKFLSEQLTAYSKDRDMTDLVKGLQTLMK
ncbi:MAG TPA: hypothetical protein VMU36_02510 [Spirochaetia bacterium]|nr:hypothetical protein [Spirochaetia bacterium]